MKPQQQRDEDRDKYVITTVGDKTEPIPLDLTFEILKRLPAESILKFRLVSKQWCFLIDSFMSKSRPRLSLVRYYFCFRHFDYSPLLYFSSHPPHPQESNHSSSVVSKHHSRNFLRTGVGILNCVRGIILISLSLRNYAICNPTTRQVIRLPVASESDICHMFLGYDPRNDQYKILRKLRSRDGSVEHSVCTLETGQQSCLSSWRHVETKFLYSVRGDKVVCINGLVYYGAGTVSSKRFVVVSFDVGSERLHLIDGLTEEETGFLINYKGKLACLFVNIANNRISLCVLDDAKKSIWSTKIVAPCPSFCDLYRRLRLSICGTTDAGEIVFVPEFTGGDALEISYYDLEKNEERRRLVLRSVGDIKDCDAFPCYPDSCRCVSGDLNLYRVNVSCDHVDNITFF